MERLAPELDRALRDCPEGERTEVRVDHGALAVELRRVVRLHGLPVDVVLEPSKRRRGRRR